MVLHQIIARAMQRLNANSFGNYFPCMVAYDVTEEYIKSLLANPQFQLGSVLRYKMDNSGMSCTHLNRG